MAPFSIIKTQRDQMAALGLTKFETEDDCHRRQAEMLKRLATTGLVSNIAQIGNCSTEKCAGDGGCKEGCYFGSRRRRFETVSTAHEIMKNLAGPHYQVTVVHPGWELPLGALAEMNIAAMRQWNFRALKSLGIKGVVAVGIVEVSLNVELSGETHWAGEIQQVVVGASREELKAAFAIQNYNRRRKHQTPVMVSDVASLGTQLGYAQKHLVCERRAYISAGTGRQSRNKLPPVTESWAEHDDWLISLSLGQRTIAYGCVRRGQKLYPLA